MANRVRSYTFRVVPALGGSEPMAEGYAAADAGQAAAVRRQSTEFRMRGRRGFHRGYRATRHEGRGHLIENPGTIRSTPD
jgi:hypothetical protein